MENKIGLECSGFHPSYDQLLAMLYDGIDFLIIMGLW